VNNDSRYRYIERGYGSSVVLVPGWASDYRIFSLLDIPYNYILPLDYRPAGFPRSLARFLDRSGIEEVSILGWSLGGFSAAEFYSLYPKSVDKLILAGVRMKYDNITLAGVREGVARSLRGYLYAFYDKCFSSKEDMRWFKRELFGEYVSGFDKERLLSDLDYIKDFSFDITGLRKSGSVRIVHGDGDLIAPLESAAELKRRLPRAGFSVVEGAGHAVFMHEDFGSYL